MPKIGKNSVAGLVEAYKGILIGNEGIGNVGNEGMGWSESRVSGII